MDRIGGEASYRKLYRTAGIQTAAGEQGVRKASEDTARSTAKNTAVGTEEAARSAPRRDVFELTGDFRSKAEEYLEEIRRGYPGIDVIMGGTSGSNSVKDMAVSLGAGTHLIVTKDFLDRMGSSPEEYLKCRAVLSDTLARLSKEADRCLGNGAVLGSDTASFWSVSRPPIKNDTVKGQLGGGIYGGSQAGSGTKIPSESDYRLNVKTSNISTASSYARLAGAATKAQVKNVMGEAHRNMASLRLVAALGEEKDRKKARAAMGSLQRLVLRGSRKIKKLDEETLLRIRKNRAEKRREREKALELKRELEKKRSLRGSSDSIINAEGRLDEMNRKFRFREEKEWGGSVMDGGAAAGALPAGTEAMGAGSFTAGDVVVSEISF